MARHQKGCIKKMHGAWFGIVYQDVLKDGIVKRVQKAHKLADVCDDYRSKGKVRPLLDAILRPLNDGKVTAESTMSLNEFTESKWLPHIHLHVTAASEYSYRTTWERYLKPRFGAVALGDIRKRNVMPYLEGLFKDVGPRVARYAKTVGCMIFNYAIELEIIEKNPFAGKKMLPHHSRKQGYAVNINEVVAMMAALQSDPQARAALGLMFFASLRPSEARAAKWENYNLKSRQLLVCASRWRTVENDTKTEEATALVPINKPLAALLADLREHDGMPQSGYILRGDRGGSLNLDNLSRRTIIPTLRAVGIEWHGYYSLRRGCGTMATEARGDNGLAAKSLLRHKDLATTTQFYVASIPAEARQASDLMGDQFLALASRNVEQCGAVS